MCTSNRCRRRRRKSPCLLKKWVNQKFSHFSNMRPKPNPQAVKLPFRGTENFPMSNITFPHNLPTHQIFLKPQTHQPPFPPLLLLTPSSPPQQSLPKSPTNPPSLQVNDDFFLSPTDIVRSARFSADDVAELDLASGLIAGDRTEWANPIGFGMGMM